MLVGQQPFFGPDVNAILHQVMNGEPPRLPPDLARLLPGEVESVLRKSLSKRQQDRFPTITAFAKAFEAAAPLDAPMLPVRPKAPPQDSSLFVKPARRPPTAATTPSMRARRRLVWLGAAAVAAAVGIGVALFQSGQVPWAPAGTAGAAPSKEAPSGPTIVPMHAVKPGEKLGERKRRRVTPER
jgi:hypothetical protein